MRRLAASVALMAGLAAACTGGAPNTSPSPSMAPSAPSESVGPTSVAPTPASPTDRILAYEALILELAGLEGGRFRSIAVQRIICDGADDLTDREQTCDDAFTEGEQATLLERLSDAVAPRVAFVDGWEDLKALPGGRPVYFWVGPFEPHGESVWVGGGMNCGSLCGHGGTFVLKERTSGWVVTGIAPGTGMWIS